MSKELSAIPFLALVIVGGNCFPISVWYKIVCIIIVKVMSNYL